MYLYTHTHTHTHSPRTSAVHNTHIYMAIYTYIYTYTYIGLNGSASRSRTPTPALSALPSRSVQVQHQPRLISYGSSVRQASALTLLVLVPTQFTISSNVLLSSWSTSTYRLTGGRQWVRKQPIYRGYPLCPSFSLYAIPPIS